MCTTASSLGRSPLKVLPRTGAVGHSQQGGRASDIVQGAVVAVLDGVFTRSTPTAVPEFHPLPPPPDEEIAKILEQVHDRVRRLLPRRGRWPEEPRDTAPVADEMPRLAGFPSASLQELVASGPRAGHPVRRRRSAAAGVDEAQRRWARMAEYSLHADVAVPAHARDRLEHVGRYLLPPPLALERLTQSAPGQLLYSLPHPRRDGSTHLLLDPRELIEKLCVLIPAPRCCLLRYHGILAPHARSRAQVIPRRRDGVDHARAAGAASDGAAAIAWPSPGPSGSAGLSWAALLKRVFPLDVLQCPQCGGRRRIVGVSTGGARLHELLEPLRLRGGRRPGRHGLPRNRWPA
jgi:hypothetical protein